MKYQEGAARSAILRAVVMAAILAVIFSVIQSASAAEEEPKLIPLGNAVGIKMFSDGVVVVGFADGNVGSARTSGLREGDVITHINNQEVDTIEEMRAILQENGAAVLAMRVSRGEKQVEVETVAVQNAQGEYMLGAWIRDSMAGIGTLTYYNPADGSFAALGHPINDVDTGIIMPLEQGEIMPASVIGVRRGARGNPGELQGSFETTVSLGALSKNNTRGVFGTLTQEQLCQREALPLLSRSELQVGPATILSTIDGSEVQSFSVEITRVFPENNHDNRDFMLRVTDPTLLAATGGIVQGMSGSPVIQDGKLVGAVTHVTVNDPTVGYGILAEIMLKD